MDRARRRHPNAHTVPVETTPDLEKLQVENIHGGADRRQFHSDEKRPQDVFVPAQDTGGSRSGRNGKQQHCRKNNTTQSTCIPGADLESGCSGPVRFEN